MTGVEVTVWWEDAKHGDLPPVCVGTGAPADKYQRFYELAPPLLTWWVIVLLPCWVLAGFVPFGRPGVLLPVSRSQSDRLRNRTAQALLLIPVAAGILVAAAAWRDLDFILLPLAAISFIASLALSFSRQSMQPRCSHRYRVAKRAPEYVVLRNVHPDFAAAVTKRYEETAGPT